LGENNKGKYMNTLTKDTEDLITRYSGENGFVEISALKSDYVKYLNMSIDELDDLSREECIRIQYILTQYAIFINKKLNWLQTKLKINSTLFNRSLMEVYHSYNEFMGRELIIASATREHDYLRDMQDEVIKLEGVINSLDGIVERIDRMTQIIKDLSFTKAKY
jgi:hypothetical protein